VLGTKLPLYLEWLDQHVILRISEWLGLDRSSFNVDAMRDALKANWQSAGGAARQLLESISRSGLAVIQWLANLIIVPVVTFYLLRDWDLLMARIRNLLPRRQEPVISALAGEADEVLGQFLRGQLMVMLGQGGIYATGLWIVGLDFAFLIGMLAGLVSFVPYLGAIVGAGVALVASYLQFQDWFVLLQVLLVFGIGQAIEGMVLTPLLIGDRLGLHPVAVIFAVLAGGQLFGFVGVLLALPVAAVIMVLLRHSKDEYMRSAWYGRPEGGEDG
jgi:predicted PurR-regulated permease PerM